MACHYSEFVSSFFYLTVHLSRVRGSVQSGSQDAVTKKYILVLESDLIYLRTTYFVGSMEEESSKAKSSKTIHEVRDEQISSDSDSK